MNDASVRQDESLDSLVAEVVDEFRERQRQGEQPDVEEYATRYPQAAELLRKVLASWRLIGMSGVGAIAFDGAVSNEPVSGVLGDFRLLREVGRGGMGVVYEAEQISLGRRVALKVLPFAATMDARQLKRFQNEARAAAGLQHTNIVPVYYVGSERGVHYYAMQFIEGRDLASVISQLREQGGRKGPEPATAAKTVAAADGVVVAAAAVPAADTRLIAGLSTERPKRSAEHFRTVARLGIQAAEALDYAHQMGIVHRDVKPANLLVDDAGRLWVTDFGLAHILSDTRLTMTGDLVGTLRYMSPEQVLAKRVVVDHRTDIYSLGATLYELLTLQPAYPGTDRQELLRQIAFEEPRRPRQWDRAIPPELETIVLKALERNPVDRDATAQEVADDLERFLKNEPIRAKRTSVRQRLRKWAQRHQAAVRATTAALVAMLVTLLLGSAVSILKYLDEREARRQADSNLLLANQREAEARSAKGAAEAAKQDAERQRNAVLQNLYYADMRLGLVDCNAGNIARLSHKLLSHIPQSGKDDLRGWEWYYLLALCHQDERTLMDHRALVGGVAWSPDGRYLASASDDGTAKVWDITSWRLLRTFQRGWTRTVSWSPDSQSLAWGTTGKDAIYVWHVPTDEVKTLRGHTSSVWTIAWSADGKRLASGGIDHTIRIWESATGTCTRVLEGIRGNVPSVAWHPDGKLLASADDNDSDGNDSDGELKIWDTISGQVVRGELSTKSAKSVAWSPDGKQLALGTRAGTCLVFQTADWSLAAQWEGHNGSVNRVAWNPQGSRLASAGADGLIRLWEPTSGTCVETLRGHHNPVTSIAWEPGGHRLASASMDAMVKVWRVPLVPQPRCLEGRPGGVQAIAWCEEQDTLRSLDAAEGAITRWNVVTGQRLGQTPVARGSSGEFSSGGRLVTIATSGEEPPRLLLCDAGSGNSIQTVKATVSEAAWFSPDTSQLAVKGKPTSRRGVLEVVDLRKNEVCFRWEFAKMSAGSWSPDGRLLAVAGMGEPSDGGTLQWAGWVYVFDPEKRQCLWKKQPGSSRVVATAVTWSPNSQRLVSGDLSGLAEVWEVSTGAKMVSVHLHTAKISALAWSPDGRRVASSSDDRTVRVWDPTCGEELLRFDLPKTTVFQLQWSPDGRRLAAACLDGTIQIWDASAGYQFVRSEVYSREQIHAQWREADTLTASDLSKDTKESRHP